MPTYEYRCPDGHDFEKFVQKISLASSELPCPVCGKIAERRISAGGGLVFKGSGFYITDYGKDGKKDLRANAASASADKKPSGTKSESAGSTSSSSSESAQSESPKNDSAKSDSSKSEKPKSDKPAAAPAAPKSSGSDK